MLVVVELVISVEIEVVVVGVVLVLFSIMLMGGDFDFVMFFVVFNVCGVSYLGVVVEYVS